MNSTVELIRPEKVPSDISENEDVIVVELTEACLTRYSCHVCGGCTDKNLVRAAVLSGKWKGLGICEQCLKDGGIPEQLRQHAQALEEYVQELREAAEKKWIVPTYKEWQAALDGAEREWVKDHLHAQEKPSDKTAVDKFMEDAREAEISDTPF